MPNDLAEALDHSTAALRDQQEALQRLQRTVMNAYRGFRDFRYLLSRSTRSMRTQDEVIQSLNRTVKAVDQSFQKLRQSMAAEKKKEEESKKKPEKTPLSKISSKNPETLKLNKVRLEQEAKLDFAAGTRKLQDQTALLGLRGEARVIKQVQIELEDAARALEKATKKETKLAKKAALKGEMEILKGYAGEFANAKSVDDLPADVQKKFDIKGRHRAIEENKRLQERLALEKEISNTIAGGLLQVITRTRKWGEALKEIGLQLLKIAAQEVMRRLIQPWISKGVGIFLKAIGLAAGGPVRAGQPYLVGERGPELFLPTAAGQIIPNHRLSAMTGRPLMAAAGPSFQFNFHIESTDGPGVEAAIQRARPVLAQDAVELSQRLTRTDMSRPSPLRGLARR